MNEKERLIQQISDAREKLQKLEERERNSKRNDAIKEISEYTSEEKIQFFDKLYDSAYTELVSVEENHCRDDDSDHYTWEEMIQILARDKNKFWKYWNSLCD